MSTQLRRKVRATGLGVASVLALAATSVFGLASASQAAYVSPEQLDPSSENGWAAWANGDGETPVKPGFTACSIVFPEGPGGVGYEFEVGERPTGLVEVSATIESFSASVSNGDGALAVLIDRVLVDGSGLGTADLYLEIPVGVHGISLDTIVELSDSPDLGLPADPTVQDVLDAVEATGDEYYILSLNYFASVAGEVQWLAFNSETHWFGTDAEWFLNDPTCTPAVPAPTKPLRVETAAL